MTTCRVYIRSLPLPRTIYGVHLSNDDGTYDVYLNSLYPSEQQQHALDHELEHIRRGHLGDLESVYVNEAEAKYARPLQNLNTTPDDPPPDFLVFARTTHLSNALRQNLWQMLYATAPVVAERLASTKSE